MDVSTEVQTSRGPVMVMTLPQFADTSESAIFHGLEMSRKSWAYHGHT